MKLSEHFNIEEFVATSRKVENTPGADDIQNMTALAVNCLEPIRELAGVPLRITSGFRSPALNKLVGGSASSDHLYGRAADIMCDTDLLVLAHKIVASDIAFKQLIFERPEKPWIHISYDENNNKRQILTARFSKAGVQYSKGLPALPVENK